MALSQSEAQVVEPLLRRSPSAPRGPRWASGGSQALGAIAGQGKGQEHFDFLRRPCAKVPKLYLLCSMKAPCGLFNHVLAVTELDMAAVNGPCAK